MIPEKVLEASRHSFEHMIPHWSPSSRIYFQASGVLRAPGSPQEMLGQARGGGGVSSVSNENRSASVLLLRMRHVHEDLAKLVVRALLKFKTTFLAGHWYFFAFSFLLSLGFATTSGLQ